MDEWECVFVGSEKRFFFPNDFFLYNEAMMD